MSKRRSLLLYITSATLFAIWALLPISWTVDRPDQPGTMAHHDTITILAPFIPLLLFWLSVIAACALLMLALLSFKWQVVRYPAVAFFLAIVAFPFAGAVYLLSNLSSWTVHGNLTDSTGTHYVFCDSSFMQGQTMALTQVEAKNLFFTRFKVLGTHHGDSPQSWASVIRPANPLNEYGQLYQGETGMIAGIRYDHKCFLAYNPDTKRFYGQGDIENISPFVCLNATDELHPADIEAIEAILDESTAGRPGYPARSSVESGLSHSNPHVREIALRLLTKLDATAVENTDADS